MNAKTLKFYESMPTTTLEVTECHWEKEKKKAEEKKNWGALTHASGRLAVVQLLLKERRSND